MQVRQVLFVCTGNTCRSLMAEYLANRRSNPASALFESAGIRLIPSEDTRNAVETLWSNFKIDASKHVPRDLNQVDLSRFALIVAIDDPGKSRVCQELNQRGVPSEVLVRWKIDDPYGNKLDDYGRCALQIVQQLSNLQETYSIGRS